MLHTCDFFPTRHNDTTIIDEVAEYWLERGWYLRQPYNSYTNSWNLKGPFHLVAINSGIVGRHFWGYEELMEQTNEIAKYGFIS